MTLEAKALGQAFIEFLEEATTPVTAVETLIRELDAAGFQQLDREANWQLQSNGRYYVKPFDTVLIAFSVAKEMHRLNRFKIVGTHIDSPGFKVKANPDMHKHHYAKLNVEVYGSPIYQTWMDRRLSLAGSVILATEDPFKPEKRVIDLNQQALYIPSVAIHRNREVNKGVAINPQKEMLPILGQDFHFDGGTVALEALLAEKLNVEKDRILDFDLNLYVNEPGSFVGWHNEVIQAPRIDNLAMAYTGIKSLIDAHSDEGINLVACFDNEEVGSLSKQGAFSQLLGEVMQRIFISYNKTQEQYLRVLADSFFISADGAYAIDPNAPEKNDETHPCFMNQGITIKYSASRSYATDAETSGILQQLAKEASVPIQKFVNRSDAPGGKTIGSLIEATVPMKGVDIGLPLLGMHAAKEHMGVEDFYDAYRLMQHFFLK